MHSLIYSIIKLLPRAARAFENRGIVVADVVSTLTLGSKPLYKISDKVTDGKKSVRDVFLIHNTIVSRILSNHHNAIKLL